MGGTIWKFFGLFTCKVCSSFLNFRFSGPELLLVGTFPTKLNSISPLVKFCFFYEWRVSRYLFAQLSRKKWMCLCTNTYEFSSVVDHVQQDVWNTCWRLEAVDQIQYEEETKRCLNEYEFQINYKYSHVFTHSHVHAHTNTTYININIMNQGTDVSCFKLLKLKEWIITEPGKCSTRRKCKQLKNNR